jgi:tRNA(Ile)-lysidine synthase
VARSEPPAADSPLDDVEFAALLDRLGPFERRPRLAVAVSGGADSIATAILAMAWVRNREGTLRAFIVDHGLRPDSADEAALVAERLARLGIPARRLSWVGPKPRSAIQATARDARYRLLAAACREEGILHLLLGHHRDDQVETVVLRRRAGSGPRGLAAMAAVRELRDVRLLRPLLAVPKGRLIATLRARGLPWIEDPSNQAERFARAALRRVVIADSADTFDATRRLAADRAAEDRSVALRMAQAVEIHPLGFLTVDLRPPFALDIEIVRRLLQTIGGSPLPPRGTALRRLVDLLGARDACRTLAGCIVRRSGDRLVVAREPAAAKDVVRQKPGSTVRWDGRFEVSVAAGARALTLRRLGAEGRRQLGKSARIAGRGIPAVAMLSLPSLWDGETLVWSPLDPAPVRPDTPGLASARLAPAIPLAGPPFFPPNVVSMAGALIYPDAKGLLPSSGEAPTRTGPAMRLGR